MVYSKIEVASNFTFVEFKNRRFLITDCPPNELLPEYLAEFKRQNVKHVVRACENRYENAVFNEQGIKTHDFNYVDGGNPPPDIISRWLDLVESTFDCSSGENPPVIAVHCIAGLGRAPVLVALSLIEAGMTPLDSIEFIRSRRRGAFNSRQIHFLDSYKRKRSVKSFSLFKFFSKKSPSIVSSC